VFKQICFFRKRSDMTMDQFMDYYENQHSQLSKRQGRAPSIPNARRYVRRYLQAEKNPVMGEVIDSGYDCLMEIWWDSREDFEASQKIIADPARLEFVKEDEAHLFASHHNPVASFIEEFDSPMGPNGEQTHIDLRYED
jgi:translation initiation factor 2B subunit (eIF-2B alpha/beta/delta family)